MRLSPITFVVSFFVLHSVLASFVEYDNERLTSDGLPFTINQEDWKPKTFNIHGVELTDQFGFISTDYLPLDTRGYQEVVDACDFELDSMPLHVYSSQSAVNYYPNTEAFDKFKGYDLIPENKDNYMKGQDYDVNLNFVDGKKFVKETIMMKRCRIPTDDGGAWHVQRIGPLVSTGGYDWWQVNFPDVGMFSEVLPKYPQGIDVTRQIFTPVTSNGTRLNLPPIHTHHIHTQRGIRVRLSPLPICVGSAGLGIPLLDELVAQKTCLNFTMYFEQHGDYICQPEDDGLDCLTQGDKNPRRLVEVTDFDGEFNDVRPTGSEPLEWWSQIAMRWKPADLSSPPVSQIFFLGPGRIDPASQLTKAVTAPVPTHVESMYTYNTPMPVSGEMLRGKLHSHSSVTGSVMLFSGRYEDLGLDDPKFTPEYSYRPIPVQSIGFENNDEVAHYIWDHLKKSQATWDAECGENGKRIQTFCARPRPEWICAAVADSVEHEYNGAKYHFDRRPPTWCQPWSFKAGDEFVVVSLNRKIDKPLDPSHPDTVPAFAAQHAGFVLSFIDRSRGHSYQNFILGTHWGLYDDFHNKLTPSQVIAKIIPIVLWQGFPNHASTTRNIQYGVNIFFFLVFMGILYVGWRVSKKMMDFLAERESKVIHPHKYQQVQTHDDEEDVDEQK